MSWDISPFAIDLDKVKIGWPWHGLLQQQSDVLCTLTSPTGEVVNFPNGDTTHPVSAAVALTTAASWRYGQCQRYQIPGLPAATTTPSEQAQGMTWQNWFCKSGIAWTPGGGDILIDEDNKVWRTTLVYSGFRPTQMVIWHGQSGAWAEKMRVTIPDPGFLASISNWFNSTMTCSSSGRLRVYSVFEYASPRPTWCFTMTITGRVEDASVSISVNRLIDIGISNLAGIDVTDSLYSGTVSGYTKLWLMEATKNDPGAPWSPFVKSEPEQTTNWSRSQTYSNSVDPTPPLSGNDGFPAAPAGSDLIIYTWSATPDGGTVADESQFGWDYQRVDVNAPWTLIGYFVGTDDQVVAVRSYLSRTTNETGQKQEGSTTNTHEQTRVIDWSSHAVIGGRSTAGWHKTQTIVRDVQTNTTISDTTTGSDGAIQNLLAHGYRAICVTQKITAAVIRQQYIAGQFSDAACFQKFTTSNWPFSLADCPKFSIHPVTAEIATRVADGRPISWV